MSSFRKLFRYPEHLLFFNSGSMSLSPSTVIDAIAREKTKYEENPTDALFGAWARLWATQKNLARFFKVRPQDIYLRQNVTFAMNDFLMALKLPKDSEILYSDLEYGAIIKICQHKAHLDGLTTREFSFCGDTESASVTEELLLTNLEKAISPKTKLVMLSHVMTGNGLKIPIEKIGRMLRAKNIFFAVDGAHGTGLADLNLDPQILDYYGSNLHKWMMGPKGTGFGWVAPHMREHLEPKFAGWTTGEVGAFFAGFGEGDAWAVRWMICSTVNFADYLGINEMIHFWEKAGHATIYEAQKSILDKTKKTVSNSTGWRLLSDFRPNLQGQLLAYELPDKLEQMPDLLFRLFEKKNIVISTPFVQGRQIMRISPNIYNTEDEVDRLALEFKKLNDGGL